MIPQPFSTATIARLRAARKALGISQSTLADRLGVSLRTVKNWELRTTSPTWDDLDRWVEAVEANEP
jgi:transcriptional regulator with XRE-family HTH domain